MLRGNQLVVTSLNEANKFIAIFLKSVVTAKKTGKFKKRKIKS